MAGLFTVSAVEYVNSGINVNLQFSILILVMIFL